MHEFPCASLPKDATCESYQSVVIYMGEICTEEGVDELVAPFPLYVVSVMIHTFSHRYSKRMAALFVIGTLLEARQRLLDDGEVLIVIDVDPNTPAPPSSVH